MKATLIMASALVAITSLVAAPALAGMLGMPGYAAAIRRRRYYRA